MLYRCSILSYGAHKQPPWIYISCPILPCIFLSIIHLVYIYT